MSPSSKPASQLPVGTEQRAQWFALQTRSGVWLRSPGGGGQRRLCFILGTLTSPVRCLGGRCSRLGASSQDLRVPLRGSPLVLRVATQAP